MHLEVSNLTKYYSKSSPVIQSIDFSVGKGEIISFIGDSGEGKTTFLKCISGLEKINSGRIVLNDRVLNDHDTFVKAQDRKIGFVFQNSPLFPHLNVKDNVLFNLEHIDSDKVNDILELTKLTLLLNRYPHQLSGGEQQRACIARALVREPDLLLLDEPFSNLHSEIKNAIRDEIYRIIKATNTTTILVTHDVSDSLHISDKILVFKSGVIQQYDTPFHLYNEPSNYYCAKILGSINKYYADNKTFYIRPENINIVAKSIHKLTVESSHFKGKEYQITAKYQDESWTLYSPLPYKLQDVIYVDFDEEKCIDLC
ncbi:MAG: hypothetical protein CND86_01500 [Bacteroidetes bacterium MED-G21]|nr:MAG: hypothetical protein CND86_01500 [Bacteroidetes bacterium MED-G21]